MSVSPVCVYTYVVVSCHLKEMKSEIGFQHGQYKSKLND
jgi:hypothetical protein